LVEEKFKIGIEIEVDPTSLADITRQIQKAVRAAFEKGITAGTKGLQTPKAGPTAGAIGSAAGATAVKGKDLRREVQRGVADGVKGFEAAAKRVEDAMNRLAKAAPARPAAGGRQPLQETKKLADRAAGPTNKNLARDIIKSRLEAGRQTTGSGGTSEKRTDLRTGTAKDRPNYQAKAEKREAVRATKGGDGIRAQQKRTAREVEELNKTLARFRSELQKAFPGRKDIARDVGLPEKAEVGPGATVVLKDFQGQTKIVTSSLEIFGGKVQKYSNVLSDSLKNLMAASAGGKSAMQGYALQARRRPERALSRVRGDIRGATGLPSLAPGRVMQAYAKGGEAKLRFRPSKEQAERLNKLKDEASIIAEVNKMLYQMEGAMAALAKQGVEVVSSLGLAEATAAKTSILRGEGGEITEVQMPVQTRQVGGMGPGGMGGMRAARGHLVTQMLEMVGGEVPKIMGGKMRGLMEAGEIRPQAVKTLKTAVAGTAQFPELKEDMILVDKSVVMDVVKTRAKVMEQLAQGLQVGSKLTEGQVLGADVEGGQVVFDAQGINAEITEIGKIWEDGVEGIKVTVQEVSKLMTGEKLTTLAGMKGVVKQADLGAMGFPEGTQVAMGAEGMAKRGVQGDVIAMMASQIAEAMGVSGQEVADKIEAAMRGGGEEAGQDIATAVEGVAEQYGMKGFTGGKGGMLTGELAFGRLPMPEAGAREQRFFDKPAMRGMQQTAEGAGLMEDWIKRSQDVMKSNAEFIAQLEHLAGSTDVAAEGLREMLPEEFARLPAGRAKKEEFAGTVLDPKHAAAMAIKMPARGGAEELMRMPSMGPGLGQRGAFKTPMGLQQAEKIAVQFDRMLETAMQIRVATGELPISDSAEATTEAANITGRAIKDMVQDVVKLGLKTDEGKNAMKKFIDTFMPFIDQMQGAADIKYEEIGPGGKRTLREETRTAGEYVKSRRTGAQKMFAIQDVLAERAGTRTQVGPQTAMGKRGVTSTESVARLGEVYNNVELLVKVMDRLGIVMTKDAGHVEGLHTRLEGLKEGLVGLMASQAFGKTKGTVDPRKRKMAQTMGGGLSSAEFRTAVAFPTDISSDLEEVGNRLRSLQSAGQDVSQSLEALDRMLEAQRGGEGIAKDVVIINQKDYEKLVEAVSREEKIPMEEAGRRLERPGLLHRFPTTGPASFLPTKMRAGDVPEGKIGVPLGGAVSSMEDLDAVVAPLRARLADLNAAFEKTTGIGAGAEEIRGEMRALTGEIEGIIPVFASARQNLDIDGDKITWHADVATEAGKNLQTLADQAKGTGVAFDNLMTNILGKVTPGAATGGIREYADLLGQKSKMAPAGRGAFLAPETGEQMGKEAFAHIAPKKAVGLLTDMFNQVLLGVTAGSARLGEGLKTSLSRVMLAINEGLGMKHGGGGVPTQFVEDMKKGQLGKITEGMDAGGEDFYGNLGKTNEAYREALKQGLRNADESAVRALQEQEGVQGDNLIQVIDQLVDKLDLKGSIKRMFDLMSDAMRSALQAEGMSAGDIEGEMTAMMAPGKKGPKGMDLDKMVQNLTPDYALTRGRFAKELSEQPGMEQLKRILELIPEELAEDMFDLSIDPGPLEASTDEMAGNLRKVLSKWLQTMQDKFKTATAGELGEMSGLPAKAAARIGGAYKQEKGAEPGTGTTFIAWEKTMQPFARAMVNLAKIAEGRGSEVTMGVDEIGKALARLPKVFAHESVHRASRKFMEPLNNIVRQLEEKAGPIGKAAGQLFKNMAGPEGIANVQKAAQKLKGLQAAKIRGEGGEGIDRNIAAQTKKLRNVMGEELLAYQTDPAQFAKLVKGIPDSAVEALKNEFERLKSREGELVEAGMAAADFVTTALLEGVLAGTKGQGPDVARVRKESEARAADRMGGLDYPGRAPHRLAREKLGLAEEAMVAGRGMMRIPTETKLPPGAEQMGDLGERIRNLLESASEAAGDPGKLRGIEKEIQGAGREYQDSLKAMRGRTPGAMPGVEGFKEADDLMRQFRANAADALIRHSQDLEKSISVMIEAGQTEGPEFREKVKEFRASVENITEYLASTLKISGRGKGRITSPIATAKGDVVPQAQELGVGFMPRDYQDLMKSMGGRGEEGQQFKHMVGPLSEVLEIIQEGGDATTAWQKLWPALVEQPDAFAQNMYKVVELMARFSKMTLEPTSKAAQQFELLASNAKKVSNELKKVGPIKGTQELAAFTGGLKGEPGRIAAAGVGGGLAESVEQQYKEAIAIAEARAKQLSKVIGTDVYKELKAAGRDFEPITKDIIDPKTGQVVQKLRMEFKRTGKSIKVSMQQAGAATGAFGTQMRNAFRRVVQWGFASGIIYGTIRALRNMVQVITEVQTKIANLAKVMDTSITNFDEMQEGAVGMAKGFGVAIDEVLEGMVVYAQQGLKMDEIMERTRSTMMAVNVTTLSTTEATEALTAVMKLFTSEMDSSMTAVDAWAAVAAKHAITAKDLALAVQRSGAAAKTAGVTFNDLLGITTAIGAVTRQTGKEVATSIKFMMRAMRRPTAQKQLATMGIQQTDVTGDLKPAMDVLGDVAGKWDQLTRAQQLSTAQAMAGIRHYNAFIVLMENWEEALDASADAQASQGFAARKNTIAMQTFSKQMQVLRETVKGFALDIGKIVLPAMTGLTKLASAAMGAFEVLPDIFKQAGVGLAIGLVGFHKAADLVMDSMDAMMGTGMQKAAKGGKLGIFGAMGRGLKGLPGMAKSAGAAMKKALTMKDIGPIGKLTDKAILASGIADMGRFSKAIYSARTATMSFIAGLKGISVVMASLGLIAIIGSIVALGVAWYRTAKSGKEMEAQLFNQIGVVQDSINSLEVQGKKINKITHLWGKYESALKTAADAGKLTEAMDAATFKSPEAALKKYKDAIAEVGVAMAEIDPSSIEGISETGEYIYAASEGMNALAGSAIDAKKATVSAMQTKVIKAYSDEITKAKGIWKNFIEFISVGQVDMSLLKQMKDIRKQINDLAKKRKELAGSGVATLHLQAGMNKLVEQELELRGQILASAGDMIRMLNQMPTFDDQGLARMVLQTDDMKKSLEALAISGAAGREATAGSIAMRQMARNVGLGGQVGMESTANAKRLRETLMEQGLRPRAGGAKGEGAIGFLDKDAARQMLLIAQGAERLAAAKDSDDAIERAKTLITGLDPFGEIIYYFEDAIGDTVAAVRESQMGPELKKAIANMLTIDRAQIEAAAERTRKLLTIQSIGALAGIRIPEGGMPQIGPGMRRELTVEQRVMGRLPDEMQRMSEVQSELTQISKRYNEALGEGVEVSENAASAMQQSFRVMNQSTKLLAASLQMENFDLSRLAHIATAMYKLQMSLEAAATAARDANIEEETRAELLKHTAGALAGLGVAPQLDMGKQFRELSAQERLQVEMGPGFTKSLQKMGGAEKQYEAQIQTVIDVRKQIADFEQMLGDLSGARDELTDQQKQSMKADVADVKKGDVYVADQIQRSAAEQLSELQRQTPLLDRMLEAMGVMNKVMAAKTPEQKREALEAGLARREGGDLARILGAAGPKALETFYQSALGIQRRPEEDVGITGDRYERRPPNIEFKTKESRARYEEIAANIERLYENLEGLQVATAMSGGPSGEPGQYARQIGQMEDELREWNEQLLSTPEIADKYKALVKHLASREVKTKEEIQYAKSLAERQTLVTKITEMRNEAMAKLVGAEAQAVANTKQTVAFLQRKKGYAMALAAQDLVIAMESTIQSFKKTEMMFYDKIDSDLEGPFARVGKPGFKTDFETRREEIKARGGAGMRPHDL